MSHRNTKPVINAPRKPHCKVCKDAGKSEADYNSHWPKDRDGNVICLTLLEQDCRYCHQPGHTVKYCPKLAKDNAEREKQHRFHSTNQNTITRTAKTNSEQPTPTPTLNPIPNNGSRFQLLMDDSDGDCDDEESPKTQTTQKKAPVLEPMKEEFPALGGNWSKRPAAPQVRKVSFAEMAIRPKPEEQQTTYIDELMTKAIASGMVVIERGAAVAVAAANPERKLNTSWTAEVFAKQKQKGGWAFCDSSDDEDNEDAEEVGNDAW